MPVFTRRNFLRGSVLSLASGVGAYVYGRTIEPGWLDIVHVEMQLRRLPDAFADFTIAQISDLHFGPFIQPSHIEPVIDAALALNADAVVITGDLVSRISHGETDMIVQTLSRLRAREGVYGILGNHDWWVSGNAVAGALRQANVTVLTNEHVALRRGGQALYVAGVDDVWCGKHDIAEALQGIPADAAVVALVHEPDYADIVANDARVVLQLSGHSHGGQVRLPFLGALHFPPWAKKYPLGKYQIRDLTLYTNRGVGLVGVPIRFACRPEVTLITLKAAN
jgi:predicted MPP superfamily phosphohydrolase